MTERRYPIHLAVLVGASTAAYAVSLAGITALQSTADVTAVDRQAPVEQMATRIRAGHDRLEDDARTVSRCLCGLREPVRRDRRRLWPRSRHPSTRMPARSGR